MGSLSSPVSHPTYLTVTIFVTVLLGLSEVSQVTLAASTAQFVFGDSLVDQGNNNNLQSIAKANFVPNGVDLAMSNHQPTGRFSNGRIISDFLSEYLGTPPILAYNDPAAKGSNLLRGCNFASAGSGILDDTGNIFLQHLSLSQQLTYFQNVKAEIISMLGSIGGSQLISDALFSFTTGGNDYINNYLLPGAQRAQQYNVPQFTDLLINTFREQIRSLYNLGARKISVSNIGPIGCIPDELSTQSAGGKCIDNLNQKAIDFNKLVQPMVISLSQELPGATIVYIDSYGLVMDLINNAARYGFTTTNVACCGTGRFNGNIPCTVLGSLCSDRDHYLFWDPFHPTDKANSIMSQRLLFGSTPDIGPINISQLIAL